MLSPPPVCICDDLRVPLLLSGQDVAELRPAFCRVCVLHHCHWSHILSMFGSLCLCGYGKPSPLHQSHHTNLDSYSQKAYSVASDKKTHMQSVSFLFQPIRWRAFVISLVTHHTTSICQIFTPPYIFSGLSFGSSVLNYRMRYGCNKDESVQST